MLSLYFQNSGIKGNINCTEEFEKMKMQKSYRYVIHVYKIRDDMREIQVEECAPRGLQVSILMLTAILVKVTIY